MRKIRNLGAGRGHRRATLVRGADIALPVERFDRLPSGAKIHFEEFNQLLGRQSGDDKYDAGHDDMAAFFRRTPGCSPIDA